MNISLPFARDFLSIACLLFGTVMVSKVAVKGRINGLQCFIGTIAFLCLWSIVVPYAYQCVGNWLIEFTGEKIPPLIALIWWPTEIAFAPLVMVLYLTLITGVVLFFFVGSDDDDEEEMRAHRRAVVATGKDLNLYFLGGLVGYWVVSRILRYAILPHLGINM